MTEILYKDECYKIVGACFEVQNRMGSGFLEAVYQECLEIELEYLGIPFEAQRELGLKYRERELKQKFRPDFICFGKIVIEIKAVSKLTDDHRAQMLNYLNATGFELGMLVNFGHHPILQYERIVLQKARE